jgi:Carboxypeptidase regulatory-like domain
VRCFSLMLFLGASLAIAQNTPQTATPADTEQKRSRVEGTILGLNGDLIRKATVRLQGAMGQPGQPPNSYSESTDNAGKFVFEDVAPGRYTLLAEKAGFVTTRYGARSNTSPGTQLNLTAGLEMKDLAIKMTPQGVIAGKVMDKDGDPVISVQVQALHFTYVRGRKQLQPTVGATTNDLGEYRLINLVPGRYVISASDVRATRIAQDSDLRVGRGQEASITTFYPNGADPSSAVAVDVAAGGEMRGIDIRLLQAKVYTVRGKAVDASGMPPLAVVSFVRKDSSDLLAVMGGGASQLRPDGTFEFRNVAPGTYVLQVGQVIPVNANPPASVTGRVEVTVGDANIDDLVLPLGPRPEITGTVTLEDGDIATLVKPTQNISGGTVAGNPVAPQPSRLGINLAAVASENGFMGVPPAEVKDDGTFRFSALGTAKYVLSLGSLPQDTYLKSARFAGQDVTNASIDLTSGTGGTLELVLSSKAASVSGSVHNEKGEALAGMTVTLWPKTPDASLTGGAHLGFTDQNGAFKFQGLAPGDYYVAAWEDLESGLAQSAEFLSHFTGDASAVTLAEGGQESRDLKPVSADKVALEIAKLL